MNNNGSRGGFFNGFVLGFILGAAVVFLLATKKGKKLFKIITEEGLDKVSDLEELLEEKDEDSPKEESEVQEIIKPKIHTNGEAKIPTSAFKNIAITGHRFFKGISKRK